MRLPAIFVTHGGGPLPLLGKQPFIETSLASIGSNLPIVPKSIVVITAHWETDIVSINADPSPSLLFDYSGFPPESYRYSYNARGSPELASTIADLLAEKSIPHKVASIRQWDHGVFVPLMLMFPHANIPVVSVSVLNNQDANQHIKVGKALASLRDQGVLLVCSGSFFHNFSAFMSPQQSPLRIASVAAEKLLYDFLLSDDSKVETWRDHDFSYVCHPDGAAEHFMPFFVAYGAGMASKPQVIKGQEPLLGGMHFVWN